MTKYATTQATKETVMKVKYVMLLAISALFMFLPIWGMGAFVKWDMYWMGSENFRLLALVSVVGSPVGLLILCFGGVIDWKHLEENNT